MTDSEDGRSHPTENISIEIRDSNQSVEKLTEEEALQEKNKRNICLIVLAVNFVIMLTAYFYFGKDVFLWLKDQLNSIVRAQTVGSYLLLMSLQIPFGTILFLPGLATLNILQAFLMRDLIASWMISFFGGFIVSLAVVAIIRMWFIDTVHKKFKHFEPYQMLIEETKQHPIRDGIIFGFVFIPANVKNYLISISELTFAQAMLAFTPGPLTLCLFCAMVGTEIKDISDMFDAKSFADKTFAEKMQFCVTFLMLILTCVVFVVIAIYYRRKYTEFVRKRKHTRSNNEGKELKIEPLSQ